MLSGIIGGQQGGDSEDVIDYPPESPVVFWNPADKHADITLLEVDQRATQTASNVYRVVRANIGHSAGRYYIEFKPVAFSDGVEFACGGFATATSLLNDFVGGESGADYSLGCYSDGNVWKGGLGATDSGLPVSVGEWLGVLLDLDIGAIWVRDSTGWAFGDPDTLTDYLFTTIPTGQTYYPACNLYATNDSTQINGGDYEFAYGTDELPPFTFRWNGEALTGAPVVTWNPSDKHADITLSNGNRTATMAGSGQYRNARATFAYNSTRSWSQKRYFECQKLISGSDADIAVIGIGRSAAPLGSQLGGAGSSGAAYAAGYFADGFVREDGDVTGVDTGKPIASLEWVGMAIDYAAGKAWVRDSTGWVGDPEAGTGNSFTVPTGVDLYAMVGCFTLNDTVVANFGASAFAYTVPTGFEAWGD